MPNYNEIFEKQGLLFLNDVSYELLTLEHNADNVKTVVIDDLKTDLIENNAKLRVIFTRKVVHEPQALFNLVVSVGAIFTFTDQFVKNDIKRINFAEMLKANDNRLFINIISRTSQLISQITSSHGAVPLVTPPVFMDNYNGDVQ